MVCFIVTIFKNMIHLYFLFLTQIDVFTTEMSCLSIVWATIQDIRLHKISV